jgi:hypothetical protein
MPTRGDDLHKDGSLVVNLHKGGIEVTCRAMGFSCSTFLSSGGESPNTFNALIALVKAMEQDEKENPHAERFPEEEQ